MAAYGNLDTAIAGLISDLGSNRHVRTRAAQERVDYGEGVFGYEGEENKGYEVKQDKATITLDADLVTSNVITTTITVDGVAQAAVATTFNTDHDTTMDTHLAALEAAISGLAVTLTDATNNRQFTLILKGSDLTAITSPVTLGASQAGVTMAYSTTQVFCGVAGFIQKSGVTARGYYQQYEAVNVLERGFIYVLASKAVNADTDAYIIWDATSADQGKFTDVATDNYETKCKFRSTVAAAGLVLVEVNGINKDATP